MNRTGYGQRSLVALILPAFFFFFSTLGNLAFPLTTTESLVVIVVFFLLILLSALLTSNKAILRNKVSYVSLFATSAVIVSQLLAGLTIGFNFGTYLFLFALILSAFALVSILDGEVLLRGFYVSAIWLALVGWPIELLRLNSYHFATGYSINPLGWRWMGIQSHPNIAGITMALLFCLAVVKYRNYLVAFVALLNTILAEHRGGLLGIVLILAVVTILQFSKWTIRARTLASLGWLLIAAATPFTLVSRLGTDDLSTGRVGIWDICQNQLQKSPWFGSGPNTITRLFGQDLYSAVTPFHCHNQLLDDLVNYGWLAGLIPSILLLVLLVAAFRKHDLTQLGMLMALLACWLVESPFRLFATQPSAVINLIVLLLFSNAFATSSKEPELQESRII
jgi:O-antigen ligase